MAVHLEKLVLNPFSENTYIIWHNTGYCIIVDPGCYDQQECDLLAAVCSEKKLNPKYLINTHCHIDHVFGNKFVKDNFTVEFGVPEEDKFLLDMLPHQASMFGMQAQGSPEPDFFITEKTKLDLPFEVQFLFTPGHTPGEYCIYVPEAKFCITGDVLFREGIGRTDLWGGNYDTLISSIENKLLVLPDETLIYPGHGDHSTIGYEKNNNPYL